MMLLYQVHPQQTVFQNRFVVGFFGGFFFRQNKAYLNLLLGMKYQSLFSLKNGPRRAKMCLEAYADSKCPDQPAHHQLLQNV